MAIWRKDVVWLRVTNSGCGNSVISPLNNFDVDTYTVINFAGALVRKDS